MAKKVLCILSEWGFWGEELVGPLEALDAAGYEVVFATNNGRRPPALPPSMDETFMDPPLGRGVTSPEMAEKTREWNSSPRLDNPVSLKEWLPEKPYRSSHNYLREQEAYNNRLDEISKELDEYAAILLVGGSGPLVDMANNYRVHELILDFYRKDKPIAAECYGVACLAFARSEEDRKSIIQGRHVTGRSTADSRMTGKMLVEVLEEGRRYYGWRGVDVHEAPQRPAAAKTNGAKAKVIAPS